MPTKADYDVIIAGAGPVGLMLAINLGYRGINTLLMEKSPTTLPWPKMDRTNARSMEMLRRIGLTDRIRELGYPADNPMDVILLETMNDEKPISVIPFDSVEERRKKIAECRDGSYPLEPYQLVSQNDVEPLLKKVAEEEYDCIDVRYGCELVSFEADDDGVTVHTRSEAGEEHSFRGSYLVGCDGGTSTVRKALDIQLEGVSSLHDQRQVIFGSKDLYEKMKAPKGRHYSLVSGGGFVAQGSRKEFTFHTMLPEDTDFEPVLREKIGFDCDIEIRHVLNWRSHLLLAEKYREGRVLLAGDAVHLVIPTGGLGMNTGVGDAFDLAWKLAGTVQGWGGEGLLDSYELERRPVAARNIEASAWAADGPPMWAPYVAPAMNETGEAKERAMEMLDTAFQFYNGRMHGMVGAEVNYSYAGSPLVAHEPGNQSHWEISRINPNARPGVRLPHMWTKSGEPIQDFLGDDYTLLDLKGDFDSSAIEAAFAEIGAPLIVKRMDEPELREVYNASTFLLRPDVHVAWRGDEPPVDAMEIAKMATGHGPGFRR